MKKKIKEKEEEYNKLVNIHKLSFKPNKNSTNYIEELNKELYFNFDNTLNIHNLEFDETLPLLKELKLPKEIETINTL